MSLMFEEKKYQPQPTRDYQDKAINAVVDAWAGGMFAPLVASATGSGKTTMLAELVRREVEPASQRALVIAHTEEIVFQLYERIENQFDGRLEAHFTDRASLGIGIVMAEQDAADARIVVATRQSLHSTRLERALMYGKFDVLVIDEAHHAGAGTTYLEIVDACKRRNPDLKVVGFTATPERGDGTALEALWSEIVFEWLIPDGIKAGYLVPPKRVKVKTEVNLSGVKNAHGDYASSKLVSILKTANWQDKAYEAYAQHIAPSDRLTLAFMPNVEMSKQFVERLKVEGVKAAHLDGTTPKEDRRRMLADYRARRLTLLSNFGVLTEGFDAPETSAILFARPTRSPVLFTQIIGRGLRLFPGKTDCLIIDLAVTDQKALETGTLIGRMVYCNECGQEYYAGMRACPFCGYIRPLRERARDGALNEEELENGGRLIATFETVFDKAFAAWYSGDDGFFSCTVSFQDGAVVIAPPLTDNYYRMIYVPADPRKPTKVVSRDEDLSALMIDADERIKRKGSNTADKLAAWREHPATPAQMSLLRNLNASTIEGLSKGAAAQMITHLTAVRRIVGQ